MSGTLFGGNGESAESLKISGNAALDGGDVALAESFYRQAIAADPGYMPAHYNLGNALRQQGRSDEALAAYEAAARLAPDDYEIQVNIGVALTEASRLDEAISAFDRAAALAPAALEPLLNRGVALDRSRRYEEAIAEWSKVIARDPACSIARYYRSMANLRLGRWQQGFAEFEARLDQPDAVPQDLLEGKPKWDGSALAGKTLLIYPEQGMGDMLQFLRYAPLCKAAGARVMVCCQPPLASLLSTVSDVDLVTPDGVALPEPFDTYISVMSLPQVCGHHPELPPLRLDVPLLPLPEIATAKGLKVGICWQGNLLQSRDRERSVPRSEVARHFAGMDNVSFFSLQVDGESLEFATPLAPYIMDFSDTARLARQLDLVVSIDTSVAHLCASLDLPTWVMLSYSPDWRWGVGGPATPWYPHARLFHQAAPGDWSAPLAEIATRLRQMPADGYAGT